MEKWKWTADSEKSNEQWKPKARDVLQAKVIQTTLLASHEFTENVMKVKKWKWKVEIGLWKVKMKSESFRWRCITHLRREVKVIQTSLLVSHNVAGKKSESEKLKWTVDSGKLNEEWKPTASGVLQAKIIQTSLFASHQFAETLKLNSESGNEQWTKLNEECVAPICWKSESHVKRSYSAVVSSQNFLKTKMRQLRGERGG